jgi:DNA-binding MarR family transcriptional regulator
MSPSKDYRIGKSSSKRTVEAQSAIREALRRGKETFGELRTETELSPPALASNLKKMYKDVEVDRKTDSEDYRVTRYSLTDKGLKQYGKQKDLENLKEMESISVRDVMDIIKGQMAFLLNAVAYVADSPRLIGTLDGKPPQLSASPVILEGVGDIALPQLREEERDVLGKCLRVSVYSRTVENKDAGFIEALKELLALVKQVAASEDVDTERLKRLPNLTFMFQLDRGLLIRHYEYLKKAREGHVGI